MRALKKFPILEVLIRKMKKYTEFCQDIKSFV